MLSSAQQCSAVLSSAQQCSAVLSSSQAVDALCNCTFSRLQIVYRTSAMSMEESKIAITMLQHIACFLSSLNVEWWAKKRNYSEVSQLLQYWAKSTPHTLHSLETTPLTHCSGSSYTSGKLFLGAWSKVIQSIEFYWCQKDSFNLASTDNECNIGQRVNYAYVIV